MSDPPRDAFASVNVGYSRKGAAQLILEEWEVRAGKDNCVDTLTASSLEQRLHGEAHGTGRDRFAAKLPFCKLNQLGRTMTNECAVSCKSRREIVDIWLANGRFGAKDADEPALGNLGRGLDGRHCSHHR